MPTLEDIYDNGPITLGPERARPEGAFNQEDFLRKMDDVPLFMKALPEDAEDNVTLQALQALAYDGTPEEIAENFKNQGNDSFKDGPVGYKDAIKYYTDALAQKCSDMDLNASCFLNRAAVNLALQNYRKVLNDCSKALMINPKLVKGYYRSAKALHALDKLEEALDAIDRGLKIDPENAALKTESEKCMRRKGLLEKQQQERERRERERREREEAVQNAIKLRGIRMTVKTPSSAEDDAESTTRQPDAPYQATLDASTGRLIWPAFFLYPEYKESDFIEAFDEASAFEDHLEVMFEQPPPWDQRGDYRADGVEMFFESEDPSTGKTGLVKVGKQLTLLDALKHPKFVVKDGIPSFIVIPKTGTFRDKFVERYKSKAAPKGSTTT